MSSENTLLSSETILRANKRATAKKKELLPPTLTKTGNFWISWIAKKLNGVCPFVLLYKFWTHTAKSDIITIRKGIKIFFGNGEKTGSCSMEF